jgi:hypothetical protein
MYHTISYIATKYSSNIESNLASDIESEEWRKQYRKQRKRESNITETGKQYEKLGIKEVSNTCSRIYTRKQYEANRTIAIVLACVIAVCLD